MSVTAERTATPPAPPKKGLKAKLISWAMKKMMASAGGGAPGSGGGPPPWVKAMLAGAEHRKAWLQCSPPRAASKGGRKYSARP